MFGLFNSSKPEKLFFKTDIHSHLIPGVDDGSPHAERSVELIKSMKSWGLERLLTTPHVTQDKFENTPEIVAESFAELQEALQTAEVDIDISYSAEYRIDEFFLEQVEAGTLMKLPNGFLLVENSFVQEPWDMDRTIFNLQMAGHKLILAHPERYVYYHDKKNRYDKLHASGMLFQVNLLSLAGAYGKEIKKMAEYLIDKNYVNFVGTDLHRRTHVAQIEDYLKSKAYKRHREKLEGRILNDTAFV